MIGPRQGGTLVTIEGENLGKSFEDVQSGVTIAGVPCAPEESLYEPAAKVVCRTGSSGSIQSGPISITIRSASSDSSNAHFSYVVCTGTLGETGELLGCF